MAPNIFLTGFTDEAGADLATQLRATAELGWRHVEMRGVAVDGSPAANLHDVPEAAFEQVVEGLAAAGVTVNCFGSAIATGGKDIRQPFEVDRAAAARAITRMQRLGTRFVRVMSYPILPDAGPEDDAGQMAPERFRRLRELQAMFAGAGLQMVHENCSNFGGQSWQHSLRLLENVPGLKLVFDIGNPVQDDDRSQPGPPHPKQSAWEFYRHVREHVAYLHVKDGVWDPAADKARWTFPGEGQGDVRRILADLLGTGYHGGISIEPHMGTTGVSDPAVPEAEAKYRTYVEYGRRLERLLGSLTQTE